MKNALSYFGSAERLCVWLNVKLHKSLCIWNCFIVFDAITANYRLKLQNKYFVMIGITLIVHMCKVNFLKKIHYYDLSCFLVCYQSNISSRYIGSHTAAAGAISNRKTASRKFIFDSFHKSFSFVCNEYFAHIRRQSEKNASRATKKHVTCSFA